MTIEQSLLIEATSEQVVLVEALAREARRLHELLEQKKRVPLAIAASVVECAMDVITLLEAEIMHAHEERAKYLAAMGGK